SPPAAASSSSGSHRSCWHAFWEVQRTSAQEDPNVGVTTQPQLNPKRGKGPMKYKFSSRILMCAALQCTFAISARAQIDPLRCEAKTLRCDSRVYDRLAGCD